jgi:hypothetical protein
LSSLALSSPSPPSPPSSVSLWCLVVCCRLGVCVCFFLCWLPLRVWVLFRFVSSCFCVALVGVFVVFLCICFSRCLVVCLLVCRVPVCSVLSWVSCVWLVTDFVFFCSCFLLGVGVFGVFPHRRFHLCLILSIFPRLFRSVAFVLVWACSAFQVLRVIVGLIVPLALALRLSVGWGLLGATGDDSPCGWGLGWGLW